MPFTYFTIALRSIIWIAKEWHSTSDLIDAVSKPESQIYLQQNTRINIVEVISILNFIPIVLNIVYVMLNHLIRTWLIFDFTLNNISQWCSFLRRQDGQQTNRSVLQFKFCFFVHCIYLSWEILECVSFTIWAFSYIFTYKCQ